MYVQICFKVNSFKLFCNEICFAIQSLKCLLAFNALSGIKNVPIDELSFFTSALYVTKGSNISRICAIENFISNSKDLDYFIEIRSIYFIFDYLSVDIMLKNYSQILTMYSFNFNNFNYYFRLKKNQKNQKIKKFNLLLKLCYFPYSLNVSLSTFVFKLLESTDLVFLLVFFIKVSFF